MKTAPLRMGDEKETLVFGADDLDPHSFYIVREHAVQSAAEHEELGDHCLAHGLASRARSQYYEAIKADPSQKDRLTPKIHSGGDATAAEILAQAKKARDSGDSMTAWRKSAEVVRYYGDSPSVDEARSLLAGLQQARATEAEAGEAAHDEKRDQEGLGAARKELDQASASNHEGLQAKGQSQSEKAFEKGIQEYERALHHVEKVQKDGPAAADADQVGALHEEITQGLVEAHINLGSVYLVRSDYQGAL